jgi:acetyltransferase-like isoleucine patch superfamily enzyme
MGKKTSPAQSAVSNAAALKLAHPPSEPGRWTDGEVPSNVHIGSGTLVTGALAFKRFHSRKAAALTIGSSCTMDGVQFNIGVEGRVSIGDFCYFTNSVLLCEMQLQIGSYVVVGWNTTISDTDFHPLAPALRILDAIALSPLGKDKLRPPIEARRIIIEDGAWIGPNVTILKGVRIGVGAWIEPGSLITKNVRPHTRVMGNPAQTIVEKP